MATVRNTMILILLLGGVVAPAPAAVRLRCGCAPDTESLVPAAPRPQDSLWMISTRHLEPADTQEPQIEQFRFLRYQTNRWQLSDASALLEDARARTVIYVHGNRIDWATSSQRGWDAYQALLRHADDPPPVRFIIWSWPSDRQGGPRQDAQTKAERTSTESYFLARFLTHLPPDTPLGMFGYSFGARILSGSLHLLGGGSLCDYRLAREDRPQTPAWGVALSAIAMDRSWWLPGGFHQQFSQPETNLLLQYNPCDPVLKLFPRSEPRPRQPALGYTGFPWTGQLGEQAARLEQQNVAAAIGRSHEEQRYFAAAAVMQEVARYVLGHEDASDDCPEP